MDGYDASTGKRIYDRVAGMTCHQCRQKTLGLHTSCSQCQTLHVRASPPSPTPYHPPLKLWPPLSEHPSHVPPFPHGSTSSRPQGDGTTEYG